MTSLIPAGSADGALQALVRMANDRASCAPHISEVLGPLVDRFGGPDMFAQDMYELITKAKNDGKTSPSTVFKMYQGLLSQIQKTSEMRGNAKPTDDYSVEELQAQIVGILRQMGDEGSEILQIGLNDQQVEDAG